MRQGAPSLVLMITMPTAPESAVVSERESTQARETMTTWPWPLGSGTSLLLLTVHSLAGIAAPPVATTPSPELLAATQVLDRLMASASIEAPITLIVRPFRGMVCPPPSPDPASRAQAASSQPPPVPSAICLSVFELPPRPQQGFFVPFVVALQRQAEPESDAQRPSAVIEERTILLNATGLTLAPVALTSVKRKREDSGFALPATAICWIAQEFAAVQLNQLGQRRDGFTRIHARLAEHIHQVVSQTPKSPSLLASLAVDILTVGQARGTANYILNIPDRNLGHWTNARLAESPHWQVLARHAPAVATSLKELQGRPESNSFLSNHGTFPSTISDAWGLIDGGIGLAAQEREELITRQHHQAQAEALRLLAAAGFDPRSCAGVFSSTSDAQTDPALLQVYEQARRNAAGTSPRRSHHFLPAEQKVVIDPRSAQPRLDRSSPGPSMEPGGTKPQQGIQKGVP